MKKNILLLITIICLGFTCINLISCQKNLFTIEPIKEIHVGDKHQILTSINNNNNFIYEVNDDTIITITENGLITALKEGNVTITIYLKDQPKKSQTLNITVLPYVKKEIKILNLPEVISVGDQFTLKPYYQNNYELFTYTAITPNMVTVDTSGFVTAQKIGKAQIKITLMSDDSINYLLEFDIIQGTGFQKTKVLRLDRVNKQIELLDIGVLNYTDDLLIKRYLNDSIIKASLDEVFIGLENVYVKTEDSTLTELRLDGQNGFANIRVAIRNSINDISKDDTLYHDELNMINNQGFLIRDVEGTFVHTTYSASSINIEVKQAKIQVKIDSETIYHGTSRLIFIPLDINTPTIIQEIYRDLGIPEYLGNLEVSYVNGRLLLVNDINIESYLTKVLPSEMPSSFGLEALKAQAVAARTYAFADILKDTYEALGYSVDDSTMSQVYNNQRTNETAIRAVNETKGIIMTYENKPINAFYFSSSCGLTANANEVWIKDQITEEIPYLIGFNKTNKTFNPKSEASMLTFFKQITMQTPDQASKYHRWRISWTKDQLTNTLENNLKTMSLSSPESFLTMVDGEFKQVPITDDIGEVTNIYVQERGESGVVVSIVIETTKAVYKVINQYNIRFTLRPTDAGGNITVRYATSTDSTYSSTSSNISILNSGFFAIEQEGNNFVFYGGGNGHGVGMSQYGARGYAQEGLLYDEILREYYLSFTFTDISYTYTSTID